jgi:PHP family Zn ribbon phosphoesterase
MQIVADLHLHSKYSRAVSPQMTLPVMAEYAQMKGLNLLTVSDWTHPVWFKEIQTQLVETAEGIYSLKSPTSSSSLIPTRFLYSTEISSIYKQGGKLRRIHSLVFVPNCEAAEKFSSALLKRGANLSSDGRPILGLSAKSLLELLLETDERAFLIPCHVWTPHFGLYGSASGFDSIEESFEELAPHIYGIETGLSSDPEMNWQIPELRNRSILSFSDAHSPAKMGREATVFELPEVTYENVRQAIKRPLQLSVFRSQLSENSQSVISQSVTDKLKTGKPASENRKPKTDNRIIYTIEFYPEEGKYHYSGHRNCKVSYGPEEIAASGIQCPVCKKKLTEGVMLRVQTLAGDNYHTRAQEKLNEHGLKWFTDTDHRHPSYVKVVPLLEVVAEGMRSTVASQKAKDMYESLCRQFGSELDVLLKVPVDAIRKFTGDKIAESISKVRAGNIEIEPGYDGEYGVVKIWKSGEEATNTSDPDQMSLL